MRTEEFYKKTCVPQLSKDLGIKNPMRIPRLEKIVISSCLKEAVLDNKILDRVVEEISLLSGQRPAITRAKKSIANFKLRKGMPIGCVAVLRGKRMYEFFSRFVNIALPRSRDFRGVSPKGFDGRGNFTLGLTEQIIFPEINYDKVDKIRGMNVTIVTTARTNEEGRALLRALGMPFRES